MTSSPIGTDAPTRTEGGHPGVDLNGDLKAARALGASHSVDPTPWISGILEYVDDYLAVAEPGSVRKCVSKQLRQADQRKDMSYEVPNGNYQS